MPLERDDVKMGSRTHVATVSRTFATVCCASALALFACTGSAMAAEVQGADYHGTGSAIQSGEIDVLNVSGNAGETVFLTVSRGFEVLAKNLPYTLGDSSSNASVSTWAGVASLDIEGLDQDALDGSYTVQVYADRSESELLYTGAIYGVYADLPDGASKLVGTRTIGNAADTARDFQPSETLYSDGRTYRLAGDGQTASDGTLHFVYEEYNEATTVDGVVKYVDATGATVATTKIPGLTYGEEREIQIPTVVEADNGDLYRTVFFTSSVTAVNPGRTSFSVYCAKMSEAAQTLSGFYVATIQMVNEDGKVIATDSVNVTGEFVYTAPSVIYKTETVQAAVGSERAVVTYNIAQSPTIRLNAATDGVVNRARTIKVSYEAEPLDPVEVAVTFNLIDGSKRVSEEGRILGTQQVLANDATPQVEPPAELDLDGTTYYLAGEPADYAFTLHQGMVPSVNVYYTPEGYVVPSAYDVTVNYVNFLTGSTIESHSYASDPNENARIIIDTPAEFSVDGVNYLRLDGQSDAIAHSYYSGIESYTVYYRDVNDELSSGTVINTIRVVYLDGTTTFTDNGTTTTGTTITGDAGTTADGTTAAEGVGTGTTGTEGATSLQLDEGRTYNVLDGNGNASLTNESGVDSNTERIEDSETPLSSGFDRGGESSAASSFLQSATQLAPVGIVLGIAVVALVAIGIVRRRRNGAGREM